MLYLSPCIFIASFNEISCSIVFPVFRFTLALASYNFVFKIPLLVCFKCKSWQAAHLKCFCGSWLLQIQNQQAALWNYLAPCKWTSAIATLPPTRFCENHWHAVSTCKWLLRVATVCKHRVKISSVWVTAAIWFFWGRVWRYHKGPPPSTTSTACTFAVVLRKTKVFWKYSFCSKLVWVTFLLSFVITLFWHYGFPHASLLQEREEWVGMK